MLYHFWIFLYERNHYSRIFCPASLFFSINWNLVIPFIIFPLL